MEEKTDSGHNGLWAYIIQHMLVGIVLVVAVIAVSWLILDYYENRMPFKVAQSSHETMHDVPAASDNGKDIHLADTVNRPPESPAHQSPQDSHAPEVQESVHDDSTESTGHQEGVHPQPETPKPDLHAEQTPSQKSVTRHQPESGQPSTQEQTVRSHKPETEPVGHEALAHDTHEAEIEKFPVVGMAFVNAVIKPMDYELNQRFYGWRPNDILNFTDNVNNVQLGVLEVTRRTAVNLAERLSRTGSTAAFDKNLENAMNWFMIKPDRYWFPAAESKYQAGLKEFRIYFDKLKNGEAAFYTRTDNLIPLLAAYENLLGSCDENLIKKKEEDGSPVSFFKSDDYFFYAKGVASAMHTILVAIQEDFNIMVTREGGLEVLHHAIESCRHAMEIDPWLILDSSKSSIFANHRANMAAPISHARFYLGVLIKALST